MAKKKLYVITCECEGGYIAVVQYSHKEAINCGRSYLTGECMCDCDFIDFKCKWNKNFDASKLDDMELGVVDDYILGLKKGIYSYVCGFDCPECHDRDCHLFLVNDKPMCSECKDKLNLEGEDEDN